MILLTSRRVPLREGEGGGARGKLLHSQDHLHCFFVVGRGGGATTDPRTAAATHQRTVETNHAHGAILTVLDHLVARVHQ